MSVPIAIIGLLLVPALSARADRAIAFDKSRLDSASNDACAFGDFNNDGRPDIACAEAWYEAPGWTRRVFRDNRHDDMLLPMDVDGDGWVDITVSEHGSGAWYRNNRGAAGKWAMEPMGCVAGHSGDLWDIDNDGRKREILSSVEEAPTVWSEYAGGKWVCHEVGKTHHNWGSGVGDVNGDGRPDIIRPDAWYEAPADPRSGAWIPHAIALGAIEDRPTQAVQDLPFVERIHERRNPVGQHGHTVQIYAQDVNGDGWADLIASSAHRMGVMWYEQIRKGAAISFRSHVVDGELSILHSLARADLDRDGDLDLLAGKRWRGHGRDEDPFTEDPLFVVWYEFTKGRAPYWKRHFLTRGEGITAGTQIGIGDYDKDGDSDVVVSNIRAEGQGGGPWLFTNRLGQATVEEPGPGPGHGIFWRKRRLDSLPSQAAAFGDFNRDGKADLAAGDFWYENPSWEKRRFRAMEGAIDARGYGDWKQDGMLAALDADGDGWTDLMGGSRKAGLLWYRNPGTAGGNWPVTVVDAEGNYETGGLWDLDRDGRAREIVSSAERPSVKWWSFQGGRWASSLVASDTCGPGAGVGDVDGDGRVDIIRPNGIYFAPANPLGGSWTRRVIAIAALDDRPFAAPRMAFPLLTPKGPDWLGRNAAGAYGHSSRIHVYDVNRDGRRDLITSSAHRVGVSWWEQMPDGTFLQRIIDASWSQAHASGFGDIDGDGDPDLVTGKNFRAEGDNDPMSDGDPKVMWYELDPGKPYPWIKHVVSEGEGIGAGADLDLADFDGDGDLDLALTGKNGGPWLFENTGSVPTAAHPGAAIGRSKAPPNRYEIGTDGKAVIVREYGPAVGIRARDIRGKALGRGIAPVGKNPGAENPSKEAP